MDKTDREELTEAIEGKTGGRLRVHFELCVPELRGAAPWPYKYIALVLPLELPLLLPIERNRSRAIFWVEAENPGEAYLQLARVAGIL